jgi:hypothetical protein
MKGVSKFTEANSYMDNEADTEIVGLVMATQLSDFLQSQKRV